MLERAGRSLRRRLQQALTPSADPVDLEPLSSSELDQIQHFFRRPKFFVMGYPRSGTTLLARLLRLSPEVSCRWQGHFASGPGDWLDRMGQPDLAEWLRAPSNRWNEDGELSLTGLARISADFSMERIAEAEGTSIVGDKTPTARLDLAIERLAKLYPDARVIAIVRDGRDAALSQRIQAFIDQPETLSPLELRLKSAIAKNPDDFGAHGRSIFSQQWLQRVAHHWSLTTGQGHDRAESLFHEKYYSLRYEDLLADPSREMSKLWRFLGVKVEQEMGLAIEAAMDRNPAADWHRQAAPDLVEHLRRGQAGGWAQWFTKRDLELFLQHAQPQLDRWHYLG